MKIPKLRGINKIRDSKIISLWVTTSMTSQEIADKFELSAKRIEQIIYTNADLVKINKDQEKNMRILRLKKEIAQKKESKKDVADLMEQLRKEIEGDSGTNINVGVTVMPLVKISGKELRYDLEQERV